MKDEVNELLDDIYTECQSIREFVAEHNFESYQRDKKTRFAVERCFEIIGEALTRIGRLAPCTLETIRDYRGIISFRNILAHAYDHIEDRVVWGVIKNDLDNLIEDISRLR